MRVGALEVIVGILCGRAGIPPEELDELVLAAMDEATDNSDDSPSIASGGNA
jgi:hypothetical protein